MQVEISKVDCLVAVRTARASYLQIRWYTVTGVESAAWKDAAGRQSTGGATPWWPVLPCQLRVAYRRVTCCDASPRRWKAARNLEDALDTLEQGNSCEWATWLDNDCGACMRA